MISVAALANGAALSVTSTAGDLRAPVGDKAAEVTDLVVTGAVDAADLQFVNHQMPALRSLDLSGAVIASYSGERLMSGRSTSEAGVVPDYAFIDSRMTSIVLPASVKEIGEGAFAASDITAINIPPGVTAIGNAAFADCRALEQIVLPDGLLELGKGAYRNCTAATRAELGSSLSEIPERAFAGCSSLSTVFFPQNLQEIGPLAFYGIDVTNLTVNKCTSLKSIGDWAFADCRRLANVYLPSSDFKLGKGAFFSDEAFTADLTSLVKNSDSIPAYAFAGNASMTVTKFEDTRITKIGDYALRGLGSVDTVTLPASLDSIGTRAMEGWSALTSVDARNLGEKVPELGDDVWLGVAQGDVALVVTTPQSLLFSATPQWMDFAMKIIDPSALDDVAADASGHGVKGGIAGDLLTLESQGAEILGFQLYDLQGRMIAMPQTAPAQTVTASVEAVGSSVVVVRVLLADSSVAVLKLAR